MSMNINMRLYVKSAMSDQFLTSVVESLQLHGWTYNEIYPGGYTNNEEMDWVFEDRDTEAKGLEAGIEAIADLGVGALRLSKKITGHIRGLRIFVTELENSDFVTDSSTDPIQLVSISTGAKYVIVDEAVSKQFLDTFATLVRDTEPELAFAGTEYNVPRLKPEEFLPIPSEIAPLTYFGPTVCDNLGRQRLMSAPAEQVTRIGDGILLLACSNYAGGCSPEVYDALSSHLGISFEE